MNNKTLKILGLLALALLGVGLAARDAQGPSKPALSEDTVFLPALAENLNDVASITIAHTLGDYTIARTDETWGLTEKGGYPVKIEDVRRILIALSEAEILEAKTKVAKNYSRLGVEGPGAEASTSTLLTLCDIGGAPIASLIIGNRRAGAGNPSHYARLTDSEQSYLISGDLNISDDPDSWLDKKILELTRERVQAVHTLHPDGQEVFVARTSKDTEIYELHDLPEGSEPKYEAVAAGMGSALQYLSFVDVQPASSFTTPTELPVETTFYTFDGIRIDVALHSVDETPFATFRASPAGAGPARLSTPGPPNPDETDTEATPARSEAEIATEVAELNAKVSGWVYELATYNKTNLSKHMSDLTQPIPTAEEPPPADAPLLLDIPNFPDLPDDLTPGTTDDAQ